MDKVSKYQIKGDGKQSRINCLDRKIRYQGHASKKIYGFLHPTYNFGWQIHNPIFQTLFYDFYATNKYILFLNRTSKESIMWLLCIYSLWHTSSQSSILLKMGYSMLPPCSQSIKLKIPYDTIWGFLVDWIENTASLLFQFMKYDVSIHFVQHSIFYLFLAYLNMFLLSFEMYSYIFIHLYLFQARLVTLRMRIPIIDVKMGHLLKLKNKLYRVS